jgi:spore maturation protein CgeB
MKFVFYTHSLVSDWNHGNAHFLRGVMRDLVRRGHTALALEPEGGWSRTNLLADQGKNAERQFHSVFPDLKSTSYGAEFDHAAALDDADVVVVHEWTDPKLVATIGGIRANGGGFVLAFHDTHHRAVSANAEIGALDLSAYDLILAFGEILRERYLASGWGRQVHTWHEAADDSLFKPLPRSPKEGDLIWIGNWGDGERTRELTEYLIGPVAGLTLSGSIRGVRYPQEALRDIAHAGYGGWIANVDVPAAFAGHRVTVHVPRRPYVEALRGIPTIRVFEALACGIPLVCAPWEDAEGLFRPGKDYLEAANGRDMRRHLRDVLSDPDMSAELVRNGLETIKARHTCRHRVDELLDIVEQHRRRAPSMRGTSLEAAQ